MAGLAQPRPLNDDPNEPRHPKDSRGGTPGVRPDGEVVLERDVVRRRAAELFGQGFTVPQIARVLVDQLVPVATRKKPLEQKLSQARRKLRMWKYNDEFRDMVYQCAVTELDWETPKILRGIMGAAKKGNVPAARLALEVTGRHDPKGDAVPTQVVVAFSGIPRPEGSAGAVEADLEIQPDSEDG